MSSPQNNFTQEEEDVLKSIRVSKVILPILIGVGVVVYLLLQQYDPTEFTKFQWTNWTFLWIGIALVLLVIRHFAYSNRLRVLSSKQFSWKKCIQLIFVWEFSSAVTPTSLGGSAVALFALAQEKIPAARTTSIVLYTLVLDTAFFIITLFFLYLIFGDYMVFPGDEVSGWRLSFFLAYGFMASYGSLFFYGLFINPKPVGQLIKWISRRRLFKRLAPKADKMAEDFIIASKDMKSKKWSFHLEAFMSTATAWACRFLLVNCLVIGMVENVPLDFYTQSALYARLESMFVLVAFSPTPGGAGFVEILFKNFLEDFVPHNAWIIASFWRLMTYYIYLLAGVIVVPYWIKGVIERRKKESTN